MPRMKSSTWWSRSSVSLILISSLGLAAACGNDDDEGDDDGTSGNGGTTAGTSGKGGTGGSTAGTAGKAGGAGTAGTAGSSAGTAGTAGSSAGTAGTAGSSAGTAGTAGTGGSAGNGGGAGTAGSGGTGGNEAGAGGEGGVTGEGGDGGEVSAGQGGEGGEAVGGKGGKGGTGGQGGTAGSGGKGGAGAGGTGGGGTGGAGSGGGGTGGTSGGGTGGTSGGGTGGTGGAAAPNLFFSEYVENAPNGGMQRTDAVEIFNAGTQPVNLANCRIVMYLNGSGDAETPLALTGTLAAGDVHVFCGVVTNAACDQFLQGFNPTGNDTIALECTVNDASVALDYIGDVDDDPGTNGEWGNATVGTADQDIRRKCEVSTGDRDGDDPFVPGEQWNGRPNINGAADLSGLGQRGCDG